MPRLEVPSSGLSLRPGDHRSGNASSKPVQIMRLNLVQSTLDELIQSLRNDQPARVRLGKHPALHYSTKSQSFHAYPETHRSELYQGSFSDPQHLYFSGVLSHSLEVEKAKEDTAATDQALANLEESLNAFERGKESKKTHMIAHPDELKALRAGKKSTARGPAGKLEKDRFLKTGTPRSLPSSPALGAPKSSAPIRTPTSAPISQNKDRVRLEALKTPFIHLLAVRAVSTKFLGRQTRSSPEDCTSLAQKYGVENRLNREKFDLKDKTYKDLDVWGFPYPTPEDRQEAIDNAISAFDRMRISRNDKLWQMLLPKEERGKGKCLSRLNLTGGPIKKPLTPRIQVSEEGGKEGDATGNEMDRGTGSGAAQVVTPRSGPKFKSSEKDTPKRSAKSKNTTLTGRVTKKAASKPASKAESKIKSAEFVHDSDDEDEDMPDAAPTPAPAVKPSKSTAAKPRVTDTPPAPTSKVPKLESSSKGTVSKKPAPRASTSPQKPSPLGSSPPANASDALSRSSSDSQNQSSSSSSSSPLINQLARMNRATTGAAPKPAAKTNGIAKASATANPLKRKAEPDRLSVPHAPATGRAASSNLEHKRRRAISTSSGGSTGSVSPPMSHELLRQRLREKSQKFKNFYAKYRSLHDSLAGQADPPRTDLDRLQKQHIRLQRMKEEIWDEDQQLRDGILT